MLESIIEKRKSILVLLKEVKWQIKKYLKREEVQILLRKYQVRKHSLIPFLSEMLIFKNNVNTAYKYFSAASTEVILRRHIPKAGTIFFARKKAPSYIQYILTPNACAVAQSIINAFCKNMSLVYESFSKFEKVSKSFDQRFAEQIGGYIHTINAYNQSIVLEMEEIARRSGSTAYPPGERAFSGISRPSPLRNLWIPGPSTPGTPSPDLDDSELEKTLVRQSPTNPLLPSPTPENLFEALEQRMKTLCLSAELSDQKTTPEHPNKDVSQTYKPPS